MAEEVADNILKNAIKNKGVGGVIGSGLNAYNLYNTYTGSKEKGDSTPMAAAKAVTDTYLLSLVPLGMRFGMGAAKYAPKVAVTGYETLNKQARSMSMGLNKPFVNANFVDNQQIYTMRQAGMALAERSKYNLQQTLMGNEAKYFHR